MRPSGDELVDGLAAQAEVLALVEEALRVPREEEPAGPEEPGEALDEPPLRGLVEIDHHIPAEDRVESLFHGPLRVHEVQAREFDVTRDLAAHARAALEAPGSLEEEALLASRGKPQHRLQGIHALARGRDHLRV